MFMNEGVQISPLRVEPDGSGTTRQAAVPSVDLRSTDRATDLERQVAQLTAATESRQLIEHAVGVLAERFDSTPDQAWQLLRWISPTTNLKVRLIAEAVVAQRAGALSPAQRQLLADIAGLVPRSGPCR